MHFLRLKFRDGKKTIIFEISILEIVQVQSFVQKEKSLNLGPTGPSFFLGCNFENLLSYLKLASSNLSKIYFLTSRVNIDKGSVFYKVEGTDVSEGSRPGQGRLRKVCYMHVT